MIKVLSKKFYLAAGECNAEGEMPVQLLVTRLIEVATEHANTWGVGYARLIEDNHAWVLSRVVTEVTRYPRVNTHYTLTTWIEGYNRHFSQRNFELTDEDGNTLGYARTIWMVIDLSTRSGVDFNQLSYICENVIERPCPIEPATRLRPVEAVRSAMHCFGYVDCDFNRHVNTVRYIDMLLNRFSLEHHDTHIVQRLEMAFVSESHYGQEAIVLVDDRDSADCRMEIDIDGTAHVKARLVFAPRS